MEQCEVMQWAVRADELAVDGLRNVAKIVDRVYGTTRLEGSGSTRDEEFLAVRVRSEVILQDLWLQMDLLVLECEQNQNEVPAQFVWLASISAQVLRALVWLQIDQIGGSRKVVEIEAKNVVPVRTTLLDHLLW